MNTKELKQLRGQIRQVVKELLPEVLGLELILALEKKLGEEMRSRLGQIDERQKNLQSYLTRQAVKVESNK